MLFKIAQIADTEAKQCAPEITITQGHRYYQLVCDGKMIICLDAYKNRYHGKNTYIQPYFLAETSCPMKYIFSFLKNYFASPLQCMLPSDDKRIRFLISGGFIRVRRCFEREFTKADLIINATTPEAIATYTPADQEYSIACRLLYETYAKNHVNINPLTVEFEEFASDLPQMVCGSASGVRNGFAFIEENEICYVGGHGNSKTFFVSLLNKIFSEYQYVQFEADDVDKDAMQLKNLFHDNCEDSFDTYIFND